MFVLFDVNVKSPPVDEKQRFLLRRWCYQHDSLTLRGEEEAGAWRCEVEFLFTPCCVVDREARPWPVCSWRESLLHAPALPETAYTLKHLVLWFLLKFLFVLVTLFLKTIYVGVFSCPRKEKKNNTLWISVRRYLVSQKISRSDEKDKWHVQPASCPFWLRLCVCKRPRAALPAWPAFPTPWMQTSLSLYSALQPLQPRVSPGPSPELTANVSK